MNGFFNATKYAYQEFILRDLLGYVTPGALVLFSMAYAAHPDLDHCLKILIALPWPTYLVLFGLSYAVGLALQNLGEELGLASYYDSAPVTDPDLQAHNHLSTLYDFNTRSHAEEAADAEETWKARLRERISVKMILSGTQALALALATALCALASIVSGPFVKPVLLIVAILLIAGLCRGQRKHLNYRRYWEQIVISGNKTPSATSAPKTAPGPIRRSRGRR